ncbi:MAG: hypothetical protein GF330_12155, partial [Candidatus Eisenbacteria bacterium]|nr:hypothetical protein [Candidatus Eisenbacteria bacterium]
MTVRRDPLLFTMAAMGIGSLPYAALLLAGAGEARALLPDLTPTGW